MAEQNEQMEPTEAEPAFGMLFEQALDLDRGTGANMPASTEEGVEREIMASEFNDISGAQDPIMAAADAAEKRVQAQPAAPQFKTFGEAFKHHRKSGDKTFEWKGTQFTTALKSEQRAAPGKASHKPVAVAVGESVVKRQPPPAAPAPKPGRAPMKLTDTAVDSTEMVNLPPQSVVRKKPQAAAPAVPEKNPAAAPQKKLLQFWGPNVGETRSPYTESTQRLKDAAKDAVDPIKLDQRIRERNGLPPRQHGPELS